MTEHLKDAIELVRRLSPADQDRIAEIMKSLADELDELVDIDPDHLPDVLEGLAQAERGEFAYDEEVARVFSLFDK